MMDTKIKGANIGARLDRLPNSGWHVKMWLVTAFALLVCWSNGIGGSVQNILLNELHWLRTNSVEYANRISRIRSLKRYVEIGRAHV